jgi:hypothetical protein
MPVCLSRKEGEEYPNLIRWHDLQHATRFGRRIPDHLRPLVLSLCWGESVIVDKLTADEIITSVAPCRVVVG